MLDPADADDEQKSALGWRISCETVERLLSRQPAQQAEIIDLLLLNSPLYSPGSLYVLMRRPRTGGEPRAGGGFSLSPRMRD